MMLAFSAVYGEVSLFVGRISDSMTPVKLCFIGMIIALFATVFLKLRMEYLSVAGMILFLLGYGAAFAFFIAPANKLALSVATPENASSTTAFFRTTRQLASLTGISIVGIVAAQGSSVMAKIDFGMIFLTEIIAILLCLSLLAVLFWQNRVKVGT